MADLGSKVVDSNILRKNKMGTARAASNSSNHESNCNQLQQQDPRSGGLKSTIVSTPQCYSDLCPDVHDTPSSVGDPNAIIKPYFTQSSVYPQRSTSATNKDQVQTLNFRAPSFPYSQSPDVEYATPAKLSSINPLTKSPDLKLASGSHSPSLKSPNSSRKLSEVFQTESERMNKEDKIVSMVQSIEAEIKKSGLNVDFSQLTNQLTFLQENQISPKSQSRYLEGEFYEVKDPPEPSKPTNIPNTNQRSGKAQNCLQYTVNLPVENAAGSKIRSRFKAVEYCKDDLHMGQRDLEDLKQSWAQGLISKGSRELQSGLVCFQYGYLVDFSTQRYRGSSKGDLTPPLGSIHEFKLGLVSQTWVGENPDLQSLRPHRPDPRVYSVVAPGDTIHVIGKFDDQGKCDVNRDQNYIIVHPDVLVSGTRVASSFSCPRRTVLDERLKCSEQSVAALTGTLLHQIFQSSRDDIERQHYGMLQLFMMKMGITAAFQRFTVHLEAEKQNAVLIDGKVK
ncbi:hypothetical protein Vadar_033929 [Vaccinium darrowii]|uniref:Uncharacterized protein n=1 Tax=Vaccinium darrowii TaxID=229202 RepID=A0ACB7XVF9_9ERIC|nr:hypothetical protein Vadar_033929 [Vaccinium darrowii]